MNSRALFTFSLFILFSQSGLAQNVRVTKVSGKKAIVVRESGPPLKVGMLLTGGGDEFSDAELEGGGTSTAGGGHSVGARDHTVGGTASLGTTSTSVSTSTGSSASTSSTAISISGFYGWNKKTMEYGPRFSLRRTSSGSPSVSNMTFGLGGFFDYNFSPNVPGKEMLYAGAATLDYYNNSTSGGSGSTASTSTIDFFVGPALKWFPLGNSVAVRGEAGLDYARTSVTGGTTTATTFLVRGGLQVYF